MTEIFKCSQCKSLKEISCYGTNKGKGGRNGISYICKSCTSSNNKKYRDNNYEKYRDSVAKSIEKNKDRHKKTKKRINDLYKENLADCYVIRSLHIKRSECTPELISIKREQMKIARYLKQLKQEIHNV